MAKSSDTKKISAIVAELVRQGWRVDEKNGKHIKAYSPNGVSIVTIPRTPSDHRAIPNTLSNLRKAGFKWPSR